MIPSNLYALHCYHNDHPCEHGYPTLVVAVEAARVGLDTGYLQDVYRITRNNVVIMAESALKHRISEISAIPLN